MNHRTDKIYIIDILRSPIDSEFKSKLDLDAGHIIFLTQHIKIAFEKIGIQGPLLSNYFNFDSWDEVNGELYHYYMGMFKETEKDCDAVESLGQFDCWGNFFVWETNSAFIILSSLERVILSERPDTIELITDHRDSIFEKYSKLLIQLADHYHIVVSMDSIEV